MTQLSIFILLLLANIEGIHYGRIGVAVIEREREGGGGGANIDCEINGMVAWPL